ncbi:hypothetical protein KBB60_00320 [Patescibacteria group bacterium]|nr:hypothetical protein [Patescibacteria group bacterium]
MDKKIAPVNKRRVIAAWFGVALLSVFCITTALFLEKSTVFGSPTESNPFPGPTVFAGSDASECQDSINRQINSFSTSPRSNENYYGSSYKDIEQAFNENKDNSAVLINNLETINSDQLPFAQEHQNLQKTINELKKTCENVGTDNLLANKDKCEIAKEIAAQQDESTRPYLDTIIAAAESGDEYPAGTGENTQSRMLSGFEFAEKDEFLQNISGCIPDNFPCTQALFQMSTNTYPNSNTDIQTVKAKDWKSLDSLATELNTASALQQGNKYGAFYNELSNLVQKCADSLDPCQQAIEKMENEPRYRDTVGGSKNIVQNRSSEEIRALSATFSQQAAATEGELSAFYQNTGELLDQCAEYKTETEEQDIESGDACEQAKKLANNNPSIGVNASQIDNLTSKELHDLSLKLSRQVDEETPYLDSWEHPRIKALNDMKNLLDRCSTIREKEETPTTTLFGFGEQLQNKNFSKWIKANLIADILTKLIKGDWQSALPPLAALLSGNEGLTNLAASLFSGNTNPRNALLDTVFGNPLYPNSSFYPGLQMGGYPQQEAQKMISDMFKINTYKNILGSLGSIVSRFMPEEKEVTDKDEVWDEECLEAFRAKQKAKENAENEEGDTETPAEEEATQPDSTPADTEEQGTTEETTTQTTATVTVTKTTTTTPPGKYDNITSEDQCKTIVETPRTTTPRTDFLEDFDGWLEDLSGLAQAVVASKYSHLANPGYYDNSSALNWLMGGYGSNYPNYNPYNSNGYPSVQNPLGGYSSYGSYNDPYTNTYGQYPYSSSNPYTGQPYSNMSNAHVPAQQGIFSVIVRNLLSGSTSQITNLMGKIFFVPNIPGMFMTNLATSELYKFSGIQEEGDNKGLTIWERVAPMLNSSWGYPIVPNL